MTRPEAVKVVLPVNVAKFHAARWTGDTSGQYAIEWLANNFGWRVKGLDNETYLTIYGRNGKRYTVKDGDWVIALGTNGSIRVCSDKQYRQDYREASE